MSRDEENEKRVAAGTTGAVTRVAVEGESEDAAVARRELSERESAALAETVLGDEMDGEGGTHFGAESHLGDDSRMTPVNVGPATRVLDPGDAGRESRPAAAAAAGVATRVLDAPEDKTSPPPIAAPPSANANAPNPGNMDPDRGLTPGMVLFGEYEIVNVLGVGGMGEVYRARHRRLDEFRAIKVMHADLSRKEGASEFFYREAKALLAVRHPAIVHCHDLLSDDAGRVYLVMEMIEGVPLSKKMEEGPLSADDVAILGARVSHGLSAAHRQGVIHRDVSPDNIVLPNGRVQEAKLIDFGIAKILEEGEGTIVDGFKGKLSYASPEQLGFFGGKLDGRSDFYSLGLVLVAAALGKPMGMGTTVMEAVDSRRSFESLPDEIPVGLRSAIAPLLALDPEDRPRYVDRLFVVPGGLEGTESGAFSGRAAEYPSRVEESSSTRTGSIAAAALTVLLVLGGGAWWMTAGASTPSSVSPLATSDAAPSPAVAETTEQPASPDVVDSAPVIAAVAEPVVDETPPKPVPRRLTASDKIKIIGLINNAKLALSENRLMTPAGDNAFDRYRRVLKLDPTNRQAKDGLRTLAGRYIGLAESAFAAGSQEQVRDYLANARKSDATHPELAAMEARLTN